MARQGMGGEDGQGEVIASLREDVDLAVHGLVGLRTQNESMEKEDKAYARTFMGCRCT